MAALPRKDRDGYATKLVPFRARYPATSTPAAGFVDSEGPALSECSWALSADVPSTSMFLSPLI